MNIVQKIEQQQIDKLMGDKQIPEFAPGDTVRVALRVVEGTRERIQNYEGVVIARKNRGLNSSFTVRKLSYGEGVEQVFPLYSPAHLGDYRGAPRHCSPRQALLPAWPHRQGSSYRREA